MRKKSNGQPAIFDGKILKLTLPKRVGERQFLAISLNYSEKLGSYPMPAGLKTLIAQLFRHGVITQCSISDEQMELQITERDKRGVVLRPDSKLDYFQRNFAQLAGRPAAATWQRPGEPSFNRHLFLAAVGEVVNTVAQNQPLTEAIQALTRSAKR